MSLFSVTSICLFAVSIIFGFFVYSNNRSSSINRSWLYFSVVMGAWALGLYGVTAANDVAEALKWQYLLDIAAPFVPSFYLIFISRFVSEKIDFSQKLALICSAVLALFSFTPLFKTGVSPYLSFFWVQPGPFYILLPIFFVIVLGYCFYLMIHLLSKVREDKFISSQIKFQLVAATIGFAGGITDFFPQVFNIYPFGNYFIILYVVFIGYAVVRHSMFNLKSVTTQLASLAVIIVFIFNLFESTDVGNFFAKLGLLAASVLVSFFLTRSVENEIRQREKIEKLAGDLENTNKELAKANDRLKELDNLKSEFVSLASHQIRGPLTAIKGYASEVLEGDFGLVPENLEEPIRTVFRSCESLTNVVEDFLNVSRIEQGKMKYDKSVFSMGELAQEVMNELKPILDKKGLILKTEINTFLKVNADRGKMKQILNNLIDNSIKYTPKGNIFVKVEKAGENVRASIKDTGVGINATTMPKLFHKFSRAEDASKANILGTGLGLYVASQMIHALGGNIWAESDGESKGSTFFVELKAV